MKIKSFLITAVLVGVILSFGFVASAQTTNVQTLIAQLQAQIAQLLAQIKVLQSQQGTAPTPTPAWCYTFNNNLGIGSNGQDLDALENALQNEGFAPPQIGNGHAGNGMSATFDAGVVASVVKFQKKYGIYPITGYVGIKTRAKLNTIYGCKTNPPVTYTQCNNQKCVTVSGTGINQCSVDSDCITNTACGLLTLDTETNLCMEKPVSDFFNSSFRTSIHTCDNCTNLPQPSISVDGGTQSAPLEVYLNNKKLLDWLAPRIDASLNVLSNPNNVYNPTSKKVTGANSINYFVNSQVKFPSRDESLIPNQTTSFKYNIVKKTGKYGSAYFFMLDNTNINMDSAMNTFDSIAQKESTLAGLATPDPYYVIAWPYMIGGSLGVEGNFYFGNHVISVSYDIQGNSAAYQSTLSQEISHEYTHNLQNTKHLQYNASFLTEGMADAVAIFSGFKSWTDVSFGNALPPGCNSNEPHDLGRCLFKHLDQDGYLTTSFFQKLFNPNPTDTFAGLNSCTNKFVESDCVKDLTKLLNYLTGKDMSTFIQKDLQNSPTTSPLITVTSPNGGETWYIGETHNITWTPGIYNGVVSVQLRKASDKNCSVPAHCAVLFNDIQNTGSVQWKVQQLPATDFLEHGNYYVRIFYSELGMEGAHNITAQGSNIEDLSDNYFSIVTP